MYEILTLNKISDKIYEVFNEDFNVSEKIENPDAILVRSFKMHDMEFGDNLLAVARAGAGTNNIPIPVLTDRGVVVFNTPGANANGVKELVLCGMLMAARNIFPACKWAETIKESGAEVPSLVEKGKGQFVGTELAGKTLGLIGLGAIGTKVAKAANALDMNVIGYDPYICGDMKNTALQYASLTDDVENIYKQADFISIHTPLLDSTREMICAKTINKMKDGVIIINSARGELVNNDDIMKALNNKKVRSYVVDFPTCDTLCAENVIAIPHLGASTEESEENCAYMAAAQIKEYLENGNIKNSVNFPALSFEREPNTIRFAVAFNNVGNAKESIVKIIEKSKPSTYKINTNKDIGYLIAESKDGFDENIIDDISENINVFLIRII
ncbi:MAG: 3-phosphoglycerate dehydrogenase [Christensenellales bacterium]|jgi:D-3-phosphoglycerate dehydrogenase|nr:3-phosphoglycerate dehydrogenase [Clostridiales bacterium]